MTEPQFETRLSILEHDMSQIKESLSRIECAIVGNGAPGIKIELDRLKRQQSLLWWAVSSVGSGVMGIVGYMLRGLF